MNAYLRSVAAGLDFLGRRGISVEQRIASGQYLSLQELRAFAAKCKRGARKLAVHPDEASGRYRRFVEYIVWRAMAQVGRASSELAFERAKSAVRKFKARAEAVAPQPDRAIKSPDATLGLSATQRDLLLQIIEPGDPRNPWRDPALRARNYVILRLDYELGPRAGDVLSLKLRDLNLTSLPPSVTFHRRHDDPEDPRARQPVLKTKPRVLYITNELADALADWIKTYRADRARFPAARRHPFLLVNKDGEPLGQRGYQRIFEKLRTNFPELKGVKSHSLRHDWNDRWVEMQARSSSAADGNLREQCYAMGWSDRSSMPARYSRRAVADSANNRILEMNGRAEGRGRRVLAERDKE
jgi:integrase